MAGKLGLRLSHADALEPPSEVVTELEAPASLPLPEPTALQEPTPTPPRQKPSSKSSAERKPTEKKRTLRIAPEAPVEVETPRAPELVQRPKRAGGGYTMLATGEERRKINCMIPADVGEALHLHAKARGSKESWVLEKILREYYGLDG